MEENLAKIVDFFSGLALDVAKGKLKKHVDQKRLKSSLMEYLDHEMKIYEHSDLSSEMDFQGLIECINDDLINNATKAIFAVDTEVSERARKHIIAEAVDQTRAYTPEAKQVIERILTNCLNIVYDHFWQGIDEKDIQLAGTVVEALENKATIRHEENKNRFDNVEEKLTEVQRSLAEKRIEAASIKEIDALFVPGAEEAIELFLRKVLANRTKDGWHPRITIDGVSSSEVSKAVATILQGCNCLKPGWSIIGRNGIEGTFYYRQIEKYLKDRNE